MAFLGIDIGTSGCKALALSADGRILASHTSTYGLDQPKRGWTQQDPLIWIAGARAALAEVLRVVPGISIKAIGLSGQMHGFTPVDRDGNVLRPAILWNDQRNGAEATEIEDLAGGAQTLLSMTNNRMLIGYTAGKILWMQRNEPALFERVHKALNPKDYLRLVLTGEFATEVSDASGTGLFDVRERCWSDALLDRLPINRDLLPECYESDRVTGRTTAVAAQYFDLPKGVPVIGGGGDSVIQTLGSGVAAPGHLQTTIGTAGIAATALNAPVDNPGGRMQVFCNVSPKLWHCMGVSLNAGGAFSWWRDVAGGERGFATLAEAAGEVPAGAGGLVFLPYLYGERCPHPDPQARGAFVGLTARHDLRHMTRAVMEGVCFAICDMVRLMESMGVRSALIKASGGGAQSPLWRQIQADLLGSPVVTTDGAAEGGAYGAALLAGVSQGAWSDVVEAAACCKDLTHDDPDRQRGDHYRRQHAVYAGLYDSLRPSFELLARLEGSR